MAGKQGMGRSKPLRTISSGEMRQKIQTTKIIKRLIDHIDGNIEMASTQVTAAKILLDRTLPVLSQTQLTGDADNPLTFTSIERKIIDSK